MDCHEVFCSCLATEASASLLFHFQDSYPSFRCIVVRWHVNIEFWNNACFTKLNMMALKPEQAGR